MTMRLWVLLVMFFLVPSLLASYCARDYPPEHQAFLDLRMDQQIAEISNYPLEEQVALYITTMLAQHPPHLELADVVAASGADVLPILVRRIQEEKREVVQVDLLYVVLRMQEMGRGDVAGDRETITALESAVSSMKDQGWKQKASELLGRIRAG